MSGRYQFLRKLGRGGMGVVDLVHDTVRDQVVARKRMLVDSAEVRMQFKREFRAVESLRHPNIVALHELEEDEDGPFFTMEHVRGIDFRRYCGQGAASNNALMASAATVMAPVDRNAATGTAPPRAPHAATEHDPAAAASVDEVRLDDALVQLIEALQFLHGAGVVHRDLKPSNVLVRDDGQVKVLDFGLALEAVPWAVTLPSFAGTPAYMAPEQIRCQPCSPATDTYALGAMLFEIVTGRLPFLGDAATVIRAHLETAAPRVDTLRPGVPRRYADACERLLQKRPSERPTLDELAVILELARAPRFARSTQRELIGRETVQRTLELRLHRTLADSFAVASLVGPTGIGKTALLDWTAQEAAREGGVVLRGRARVTEHIAFNGLDGAIDGLAMALHAPGGVPADDEALSIASSVFPVLGGAARMVATRMAAFAAVINLVRRVAASLQVTLIVDDVQWADPDSLALLDELVHQAPSRMLIVVACRDDVGETAGAAWAQRHGGDVLVVASLPAAEVRDLVGRRVHEYAPDATVSERTLARVVAQCNGRPVLAELAARELAAGLVGDASDLDLSSVLVARVRAAPPAMRRLLGVLATVERWTGELRLRSVSALSATELADSLAQLQHQGLAVSAMVSRGDLAIDLAHDVVRAAVLEALDATEVSAAHQAWADALAADPGEISLYRRVHHLVAAGRLDAAAPLARGAASAAARHGAFGLAAELYDIALRAPRADTALLLRARAIALEEAGRHGDAAASWRALHDASGSVEERVQAAIGEAQATFASGEIAAGLERLDTVLSAAGEPSVRAPGVRGVLVSVAFLLGPRGRLRADTTATPEEIERIELEVRVAQTLSAFEPIASLCMLQRAQARALRLGLAEVAAWCDYLFSAAALYLDHRAGPSRLADRYRERGERLLAGRSPRIVDVVALRGLCEFWMALREARWQACIAHVEREIARLDQHGRSGGVTHLAGMMARIAVDMLRTDVSGHARQAARLHEAARAGRRGALGLQLAITSADTMIFHGDFEGGRALLSDQIRTWRRGVFGVSLVYARLALCELAEHRLAEARAHGLALDAQRRPGAFRNIFAGVIAARMAAIEAACLRAGVAGASAGRLRKLTRIARRAPPFGLPLALRAEASLAEHEGDVGGARWLLLGAEREAERLAMPFDVARARYLRGKLLGGTTGATLVASARDVAASVGASERVLDRLP